MRTRILAAALATIAIAGAACDATAQMMGPGTGMGFFSNRIGRGGGMPGSPANMQALAIGWLGGLHAELRITPAQEAAWQPFANAVTAEAVAMQQMRSQILTQAATAPQRASIMEQFMRQRLAAVEAVSDALDALYAVLDAGQRSTLDAEFANQCGALGLFGG